MSKVFTAKDEMEVLARAEWERTGRLRSTTMRNAVESGADISFLPDELAYSRETGDYVPVRNTRALSDAAEQLAAIDRRCNTAIAGHNAEIEKLYALVKVHKAASTCLAEEACEQSKAVRDALCEEDREQLGMSRTRKPFGVKR